MKVKLLDTGENAVVQALVVTNNDPEFISPTAMDIDPDGYVTLLLQVWGEDKPREYSFHLDEMSFSVQRGDTVHADHYLPSSGNWPLLPQIYEKLEKQRNMKNGK